MTDSQEFEELVQVLPGMVGSLLPFLGSGIGQALQEHYLKQKIISLSRVRRQQLQIVDVQVMSTWSGAMSRDRDKGEDGSRGYHIHVRMAYPRIPLDAHSLGWGGRGLG